MAAHALHIFPLPLVVFEFEKIHLHIFEPRYNRLVHDCVATDLSFGIPFYYKNKMYGTGAEVRIAEIVKTYESGEMDIVCQAGSRFELLEHFPSADVNQAGTALVNFLPYMQDEEKELDLRIYDLLAELYRHSEIHAPAGFEEGAAMLQFAHKCGLSPEQEYEMSCLQSAAERQLYMLSHLKELVAVASEIDRMKKLIRLNGHFKKLPQQF